MKASSAKHYFFYMKIIISAAIFWALTHNSQLKLGLFSTLLIHPFPTLTVIGLCLIMVFLHSWRWYRLNAAQNISLSFSRTIAPTYLGIGFNSVLPGSVGGDFVRLYYILKKFPAQKSAAILSILVDRINGLMGILLIACIVSPYYLNTLQKNSALFYLLLTCASVFICGIVFFLALTLLLSEKVGIASWLEVKLSQANWSKRLLPLLDAIHVYRNAKLIILESLLLTMLTQVLLLIVIIMINKMMELPMLSPFDFMVALVIGQVANLIPLTPGGIGVGEAAFANIILLLNPNTTAAYATVFFALRLLSTIAYLPGVILGVFRLDLLHKNFEISAVNTDAR